jgi:hypothetical protein
MAEMILAACNTDEEGRLVENKWLDDAMSLSKWIAETMAAEGIAREAAHWHRRTRRAKELRKIVGSPRNDCYCSAHLCGATEDHLRS